MSKEKITPVQKPVPSSGGVKEGYEHLTTPKQETEGRAPWHKEGKEKIF